MVVYPIGDYRAPALAIILMSQYVMHHDSRYYPNPFRFDPERWTPEAFSNLKRQPNDK